MDYRKLENTDLTPSLLGYGCMRFPEKDGKIDEEQSFRLLRAAVDGGVNYFDTAYIYHEGKSEEFTGRFLKKLLNERSRDSFYISTKLPLWLVESLDDAKRIFAEQLERLQSDYIDFYMLHDLKLNRFDKMKDLGVIDYCLEMQKAGKIKHFGFSTHEGFEGFKKIIDYRDWEFVLLQLNYMDLDNLKHYESATEKNIPVIAMETVRGGSLAKLPENILKIFTDISEEGEAEHMSGGTPASFAMRWAGSLPNIKMILSGMSDMEQVKDNLKTCSDFKPLSEKEREAIKKVEIELRKRVLNGCTGCNYCMPCPMGVNIPWVLSIWNDYAIYKNRGHANWMWSMVPEDSRPPKCNECGKCNEICSQKIDVIADLKRAQVDMEAIKW
jgi:hypothetical protein